VAADLEVQGYHFSLSDLHLTTVGSCHVELQSDTEGA